MAASNASLHAAKRVCPDPIGEFHAMICDCGDVSVQHCHCPCDSCNYKPVSRKTAYRHALECKNGQRLFAVLSRPQSPQQQIDEQEQFSQENEEGDGNGQNVSYCKALIDLLQLKGLHNMSIKCIEDLLKWANDIRETPDMPVFSTSWQSVQKDLKGFGYSQPRLYYICLHSDHPCHYDLLSSDSDFCRYCGRPGTVKYYYLSVIDKLRNWVLQKHMCEKMIGHWKEKAHWLQQEHSENDSNSWGYSCKKEVWDGQRFAELSYFWDPEKEWTLPARCTTLGCNGLLSAQLILGSHLIDDSGLRSVTCPLCYCENKIVPKTTFGDPRNIAYIGHWDGWQPFNKPSHGCGTISVSVATMSKKDRNHADQVFVLGFVPTYLLPKQRSILLDPFLAPFCEEIIDGFIEGIDVDYALSLPGYVKGPAKLRHLLLMWTGDHVAQCEVSKGIFCGKKPCRFCTIEGEMALGSTHYYYGNYNQFARCPKQRRELTPAFLDSLASVDQEERQSVRHSIAKELGFKGTTIFHQFYHLYGFKLTTDFVIDAQHGLPLGVVKHDFQRMFDDSSELDGEEGTSQSHKFKLLSERLAKFPWTAEMRASRIPTNAAHIGFWKAEEWKKFAYPVSEPLLYDLTSKERFEIWQCLSRIIEYVYGDGRNGWTEEGANVLYQLCLRHNILLEAEYGLKACKVIVHNLVHLRDCVKRFGSLDNYWCYCYERAVQRYAKTPNNGKNIELTLALCELQREFVQCYKDIDTLPPTEVEDEAHGVAQHMLWAKRLSNAHDMVEKHNKPVLAGKVQPDDRVAGEFLVRLFPPGSRGTVSTAVCNKVVLPRFCGMVVRSADTVMASCLPNGHITNTNTGTLVEIRKILSVCCGDLHQVAVEADTYRELGVHTQTGLKAVCVHQTKVILPATCLIRKTILLPLQEDGGHQHCYLVLDFMRPYPITRSFSVIVPIHLKVHDMVMIMGDNDQQWFGQVVDCNCVDQERSIRVAFYIQSRRRQECYERESRHVDKVSRRSIIGLAKGTWTNNGKEWIPDSAWQ